MSTVDDRSVTVRDQSGCFAVGNPGRVPGSKNRFAAETMRQIKEMTPDALEALHTAVKGGSIDAIKFVLHRVVGQGRMIELDGAKPSNISDALLTGELTTEEAKAIATVVERLYRIEEMDAVLNRVAELERLLKG